MVISPPLRGKPLRKEKLFFKNTKLSVT